MSDDLERLADIGDQVLAGTPIEQFNLSKYEFRFVIGYCARGVETFFDAPERVLPTESAKPMSEVTVRLNLYEAKALEAGLPVGRTASTELTLARGRALANLRAAIREVEAREQDAGLVEKVAEIIGGQQWPFGKGNDA